MEGYKKIIKSQTDISPVRNPSNLWATTDSEKANAFATHLASVFMLHDIIPNSKQLIYIEQSLNSPILWLSLPNTPVQAKSWTLLKNFQQKKPQATTWSTTS